MKNRIELTIEHKDHNTVELTNDKGDTFTYDPQKHEGLEDFLSGAKILPIAVVSKSVTCDHNYPHVNGWSIHQPSHCSNCGKDL